MEIKSRLDEVMKTRGVSLEKLAHLTNLTRMTINNARNGKLVTLRTAVLIATALEVTIEDLWDYGPQLEDIPLAEVWPSETLEGTCD
jgi:DNA-binding Xre family transcriptional regulator